MCSRPEEITNFPSPVMMTASVPGKDSINRRPSIGPMMNTEVSSASACSACGATTVTLWEAREKCYRNLAGAEHAAEFMTLTFDCTDFMRKNSPAAVHVDGTARPQLIRREKNPEYYDILKECEKRTGIPTLINTSFNMHEEPIVCSPNDAVRAFLDGNIDGLAAGPFFVAHPRLQKRAPEAATAHA